MGGIGLGPGAGSGPVLGPGSGGGFGSQHGGAMGFDCGGEGAIEPGGLANGAQVHRARQAASAATATTSAFMARAVSGAPPVTTSSISRRLRMARSSSLDASGHVAQLHD